MKLKKTKFNLKWIISIPLSFFLGVFVNDLTESTGIIKLFGFNNSEITYTTNFQYTLDIKNLCLIIIISLLYLFYSLYLNKNHFLRKDILKTFRFIVLIGFSLSAFTLGLKNFHILLNSSQNNNVILIITLTFVFIYLLMEICYNELQKSDDEKNIEIFPERIKDLERIKATLKNYNIVGIDGEWGEGKTFLIEKIIETNKNIEVIDINLMNIEKEDILKIIIAQFDKILKKYNILSFKSRKIKGFMNNQSFLGINLNGIFSTLTPRKALEEYLDLLSNLNKDIYIIFDDMDRISDIEKIKKALSIGAEFNKKNIKIIYLYSQINLDKLTGSEKVKLNKDFIEKFIPISYQLTKIKFSDMIDLKIKEIQKTNPIIEENDFIFIKEVFSPFSYTGDLIDRNRDFKTFNYIKEIMSISDFNFINEQIRKIELFLNEVSINLKHSPKIEKRLVISFCFIKTFCNNLYQKFKNMDTIDESFPLILDEKTKLTITEFLIIKKAISIKNINFNYNFTIINNKRLTLEELKLLFEKIDIDLRYEKKKNYGYDLKKVPNLVSIYKNRFIITITDKEKLCKTINEMKFDLKNIKENDVESTILLYGLFNYPLFLNTEDKFYMYNRQNKINKQIKKLTTIGNIEFLSEAESDYTYLKEVFKEKDIKKRIHMLYSPEEYGATVHYNYLVDHIRNNFEKDEILNILKYFGENIKEELNSYLETILYTTKINNFTFDKLSNNEFLEHKDFREKIIKNISTLKEFDKKNPLKWSTLEKFIQNFFKVYSNENCLREYHLFEVISKDDSKEKEKKQNYIDTMNYIIEEARSSHIYILPFIKKEVEDLKTFSNYLSSVITKLPELSLSSNNSIDVKIETTFSEEEKIILDKLKSKTEEEKVTYLDDLVRKNKIKRRVLIRVLKELKIQG